LSQKLVLNFLAVCCWPIQPSQMSFTRPSSSSWTNSWVLASTAKYNYNPCLQKIIHHFGWDDFFFLLGSEKKFISSFRDFADWESNRWKKVLMHLKISQMIFVDIPFDIFPMTFYHSLKKSFKRIKNPSLSFFIGLFLEQKRYREKI